jgi:hypothetical protein
MKVGHQLRRFSRGSCSACRCLAVKDFAYSQGGAKLCQRHLHYCQNARATRLLLVYPAASAIDEVESHQSRAQSQLIEEFLLSKPEPRLHRARAMELQAAISRWLALQKSEVYHFL